MKSLFHHLRLTSWSIILINKLEDNAIKSKWNAENSCPLSGLRFACFRLQILSKRGNKYSTLQMNVNETPWFGTSQDNRGSYLSSLLRSQRSSRVTVRFLALQTVGSNQRNSICDRNEESFSGDGFALWAVRENAESKLEMEHLHKWIEFYFTMQMKYWPCIMNVST